MLMILGSGRSGTTWLAKLFDSHPDVLYRHEPDSILRTEDIPFLPDADQLDGFAEIARTYLGELKTCRASKSVGTQPQFPKNYRSSLSSKLHQLAIYGVKGWEKSPLPTPSNINIPDLLDKREGRPFLVIKSVNSLCRMKLFHHAIPDFRFVHILRHPCGVISSVLRGANLKLMAKETYIDSICQLPEAQHYPYTKDKVKSLSWEEQMAYAWMVTNDKASMDMQNSNAYHAVIYEKLCVDLESELRRLYEHAGLNWSDQTAQFLETLQSKSDETNASYFNIMRPPTASLDKWKTELSKMKIDRIFDLVSHARTKAVKSVVA